MDEIQGRIKIGEELRWKVLKRDGYKCRYCGRDVGPFHMDHVYPVVKGGETSYRNLVTACDKCNMHKHDTVGMWPFPVGHFDKVVLGSNAKLGMYILAGIILIVNSFFFSGDFPTVAIILFVIGLIISIHGSIRLLTGGYYETI
jgi:hypothetical protein